MIDFEFEYKGFRKLSRKFKQAGHNALALRKLAHYRMGAVVKDRAALYAPKSPTDAERRSVSKASAKQWAAARKRRSKTTTSRRKPGALQHSISMRTTPSLAEIYVPVNSPAGAYAWKIHEEKGISWQNRGIGTVKKGPQADDKFIERAIEDSEQELIAILADEMEGMRNALAKS